MSPTLEKINDGGRKKAKKRKKLKKEISYRTFWPFIPHFDDFYRIQEELDFEFLNSRYFANNL